MSNTIGLCKERRSELLVVEGKDDCHGIYQFAAKKGLSDLFGIWAGDSDEQALSQFGGLLAVRQADRPSVLGLVLDCDTAEHSPDPLTRRWQQVQSRLSDLGYVLPKTPSPNGTILDSPDESSMPRVGIWIMPDNVSEGMFEDFLLSCVRSETKEFAEGVVTQAKADGHGDFNNLHRSKAVAHTVLAWRDEPGKPIGIAMKMGLFRIDGPLAETFAEWLKSLFRPHDTDILVTALPITRPDR